MESSQASMETLLPQALEHVVHHALRFKKNVARARRLLSLQQEMSPQDAAEVLRAIVVFTHSALEDTLRNVVREIRKSSSNFKDVPLVGTMSPKFSLSDLARHHSQKSIADVLDASLDGVVNQMTFNDPHDLASVLEISGIANDALRVEFPLLGAMISRRHQIVHQADTPKNSTEHEDINGSLVTSWVDATTRFVSSVLAALALKKSGVQIEEAPLE